MRPDLHISRRACLVSGAAALASPAAAAREPSRLDTLISDWHAASAEANRLWAEAERIRAGASLPDVSVQVGPHRCRYPHQIHWLFDPWIEGEAGEQPRELTERLAAQRDRLVGDLLRQEDALIAAEVACGLTSAEKAAERAEWREIELRNAILAYQPGTLDETATKAVFLLDRATREIFS